MGFDNIIHASIRGDKPDDISNQDYVNMYNQGDLLIASISDGLGSAVNSHIGAKAICDIIRKRFSQGSLDIDDISNYLINDWGETINLLNADEKDYRTTNAFIVILKNEKKIVAGRLGDIMLSLRIDGLFRYFKSSQKDFLNETICLGSETIIHYQISVYSYTYSYDFLLATDGFGDEIVEDRIQDIHNYFINKYSNLELTERNSVLEKELKEFVGPKNNDDKSLMFCWSNPYKNECN